MNILYMLHTTTHMKERLDMFRGNIVKKKTFGIID